MAIRNVVPLAAGTGSVLAEKAIDLFVLLAFAALGAALHGLWAWATLLVALLLFEAITIAVVVARRSWLERMPLIRRRPETIEELFSAFDALRRVPATLASVSLVSLGIRVLTVVVTYALLVGVGADVSLVDTLTLWPAAMVVGLAPLTLAGMGTRDATFLYLLGARGSHVPAAAVLAATMGYSAVAIWSFAILGLPLMIKETLSLRRSLPRP